MATNYRFEKVDLAALDSKQLKAYDALTEEKFRCCLRLQHPEGILNTIQIAIAATCEGEPVGLILASFMPFMHRYADVHTIFVDEKHRHAGIATRLFTSLEQELLAQKCASINMVYPENCPNRHSLEEMLKKLGWSGPNIFSIHFRINALAFAAPWLRSDYKYPALFTEFSWSDLTKEDQHTIEKLQRQELVTASVSPVVNKDKIEPANSLGLRYKGKLVGWMITHREDENTIRYAALFITREFEKLGPAMKLLCDSIFLHKKSGITWAVFDINIGQSQLSWIKFVKRRLIPYADEVRNMRQMWKELGK